MTDDRSITGSAVPEAAVHDDDELAEVLAAELERYATGNVPVLPRMPAPQARDELIQPLAVPSIDSADRAPSPSPRVDERSFASRAAEVERAMRRAAPETPSETFRGPDRPSGRRSATGPIMQPTALPTADDLPVKRRSGFRPPPSAAPAPRIEPIDRVLPPTGPVSLPEPTASLLDSMITGSIPVVDAPVQRSARHAAPAPAPEVPTAPAAVQSAPATVVPPLPIVGRSAFAEPAAPGAAPAPSAPAVSASAMPSFAMPAPAGPASTTSDVGRPQTTDGFYADWEQSLRSIGRPRPPWEVDDEVVPTGGDPDLPTVAVPVQRTGPVPSAPVTVPSAFAEPPTRHGVHALPEDSAPVDLPPEALRPRRSGRRRAAVPADVVAEPPVFAPPAAFTPTQPPQPALADPEPVDRMPVDADDEGLDEVAVDYPVVSAATTGAIDIPTVEPRPRTAPVFIERVRTALLQLPTVPPSPTGSGAAAIVGRWIGAFASPLLLVLAFGLAGAGAGPAAVIAVVAGALLAVPAVIRTAGWSARTTDDAELQEAAVLGAGPARIVAAVLLLARLGAAATVLFAVGSMAGAWADRTGALGLGASNAALLGSTGVAVLAILVAALSARATAVLTLLAAVLGAIGTVLVALVLAPNGGAPIATTAAGGVAAGGAGLAGVGLLLVLCGADVARWRTDLANPVSTAVGGVVSVVCGVALVIGGTLITGRLTSGGDAVDEFAGALSDASASLLAAPLLLILLVSAITLPALLLRSAGASAARLLGAGRPVRLGAVASGLVALAVALGLLAAGVDTASGVLAATAIVGVPVAAWAGLLAATASVRRSGSALVGLAVATLLGWALSDGIVPGWTSPLLAALPASSGVHGGPVVGLVVALLLGAAAGVLGGSRRGPVGPATAGPADTVEG